MEDTILRHYVGNSVHALCGSDDWSGVNQWEHVTCLKCLRKAILAPQADCDVEAVAKNMYEKYQVMGREWSELSDAERAMYRDVAARTALPHLGRREAVEPASSSPAPVDGDLVERMLDAWRSAQPDASASQEQYWTHRMMAAAHVCIDAAHGEITRTLFEQTGLGIDTRTAIADTVRNRLLAPRVPTFVEEVQRIIEHNGATAERAAQIAQEIATMARKIAALGRDGDGS